MNEENKKLLTKSGATRSEAAPRYDLLPMEGLRRLANRFGLGLINHGKDNWKKGLRDEEFLTETKNHMVHHMLLYLQQGNVGDDNLAAIAWGAHVLMEAEHVAPKER